MPVGGLACQAKRTGYSCRMAKAADPDKAERLAAALRANLQRRKARDRAQEPDTSNTTPPTPAPPPLRP